jgi:hypothetical protein
MHISSTSRREPETSRGSVVLSTSHVCTANMIAERTVQVQWWNKIKGIGNDLQNQSRRNTQLVSHVRTCKNAAVACCYSGALQAAFGVSEMTADISLCSSLSTTSHVNILCLISESQHSVRGVSSEFPVGDNPIVIMCQWINTKLVSTAFYFTPRS